MGVVQRGGLLECLRDHRVASGVEKLVWLWGWWFGGGLGGLRLVGLLLAGAAAAQEQINDLLEAEGDDEAEAEGDDVDEHGFGMEHGLVCADGIADAAAKS